MMKKITIIILFVILSASGCLLKEETEMKQPQPQSTPPATPIIAQTNDLPVDVEIYADNLTLAMDKGSSVELNLTIIGKNVTGGKSISLDYYTTVLYPDGTIMENPVEINFSFKPQHIVFPETVNMTSYKLFSKLTISSAIDGDYIIGIKTGDKKLKTFAHMYLFSWDRIPGNEDGRLREYMRNNFGIDWVKTARIEKIDGGKAIRVYNEKNSLSLRLNDEKTEVNLEIDNGATDKFTARIENGELNIYAQIIHLKVGKGGNLSSLYQMCTPLPFAYFDRIPEPGARDVPVTTNISISFSRSPSIVELEMKPEVKISNITRERVGMASGKVTFHPATPLLPGTTYTVTVTYGQKNPPRGSGNFCPTSNIAWQFITDFKSAQ